MRDPKWTSVRRLDEPPFVRSGQGADHNASTNNTNPHVVADIVGYFDGVTADRYNALDPTHVLDSHGSTGGSNAKQGGGTTQALPVRARRRWRGEHR